MFEMIPFYNHRNGRVQPYGNPGKIFDGFFSEDWLPFRAMRQDTFRLDMKERENEYLVYADLAGCKREDIRVEFEEGRLMISVHKEEEQEDEGESYIHRERFSSSMQRSVYLHNASGKGISARLEEGVLKIHVPKNPVHGKNKRIDVQ